MQRAKKHIPLKPLPDGFILKLIDLAKEFGIQPEDMRSVRSELERIVVGNRLQIIPKLRHISKEERSALRKTGPCIDCGTETPYDRTHGHILFGDDWLDRKFGQWSIPPRIEFVPLGTMFINGIELGTCAAWLCARCRSHYQEMQNARLEQVAEKNLREKELRADDSLRVFQDSNKPLTTRFHALPNCFTSADAAFFRAMPYRDFIRTDYWDVVRRYCLYRAGFTCELCNTKARLHVHHKTYEHHGNEHEWWAEDLIVLCQNCHGKFHNKLADLPESLVTDGATSRAGVGADVASVQLDNLKSTARRSAELVGAGEGRPVA